MKRHARERIWPILGVLLLALGTGRVLRAQGPGHLQGNVTDPSGAVVPRATVRVTAQPSGPSRTVRTDSRGHYEISGLAPGSYTVTADAPGFSPYVKTGVVIAGSGTATLDIGLAIAAQSQKVEVNSSAPRIELSPESNSTAVVITGHDLSTLSNDPDELQSQLGELAGPSVGAGGGEIYVNGLSGADLPPKADIREIRVNSNPFAVQNDRLGYGRVDVVTKPGSAAFHGSASVEYNNSAMNALSPFLAAPGETPPSYHTWLWNGELGGPLGKNASFFVNFQRRDINRANLVNTEVLDSNLNIQPYVATVANPRTFTAVGPRLDFELSPNNTLTVSYGYYNVGEYNDGVDTQALPSQAYDNNQHHHDVQIFDSQVFGPRVVNEIRFEYIHFHDVQKPLSLAPTIDVLGAFLGGGNSNGALDRHETHYELQNLTTMSLGGHLIQFGGMLRVIRRRQEYSNNFNGTFTFNSLADYQQTEQGLQNGLTMSQIQAAGYGPSQYNVTSGTLSASVTRVDTALFAGDDWHLRPHFTASYGLRFESENVISDHADWAPRFGIAWGLGHGSNVKTVLRAGWGIFYQRFDDDQMIVAARLNGQNQITYIVAQPGFFPAAPPASALAGVANSVPTVYRISPTIRSPYDMDTAVSLERQLLPSTTISLTYIYSRGDAQFLVNDVNAPLPGTFTPGDPSSGVRPLGNSAGNIYEYQSAGIFRQTQWIANVHVHASRVSIFGYYVFNDAHSDADGADSFPANPWNIYADYGRAAFGIRHRAMIGGTLAAPLGIRLSSVMMANSGMPFSITLPQDLYGTGIHNARPAPATASTPAADLVVTPYGAFNIAPGPSDVLIPPNTETGPANFMMNLRLSRTFGLGGEGGALHGGKGTAQAAGAGRRYDHRAGLGGRGLGGGGGFGLGGATSHRYALTLSVSVLNLLNNVNLAPPVNVLGSPLFGRSIALASGPFSAQVGNPVANRLINVGASFSF
ncbi:MAG TPA: carboxypeptidase regulatory-like domain-containing protein [Patescibacteria group bacterium]|nr:carboxypeptidase regulatory-like domain-containing protein [Patescibacteria group bacterium]